MLKKILLFSTLVGSLSTYAADPKKPASKEEKSDAVVKNENAGDPISPGSVCISGDAQGDRSPAQDLQRKLPTGPYRAPGPSTLQICYHRNEKTKTFVIDYVRPGGDFGHLHGQKETDIEPKPKF